MRRLLACAAAAAACALVLPVPATAIVGGQRVGPSDAPWFARTGVCGGTLIAPDRVATAAHCFDPIALDDLDDISVAGQSRRGVRVALAPTWRVRRAGFALDDVAIVQLDRPVTGVRPAALAAPGDRVPARVRVLGRGQTKAPAPGKTAQPGLFGLHQAALRTLGDADCERRWKRSRTKYRNRFDAPSALCATDARGRASVCAGDSGGPMIAGTLARPVLVGVISWTGPRCGADRLPSVANEVAHYFAFFTDPAPAWAPMPSGPARVRGDARVGRTLTCELPAWEVAPERVDVRWMRRTRTKGAYEWRRVGTGPAYVVTAPDRGQLVSCEALGSGPGGRTPTPADPAAAVRVAG